MHIVIAPDKFKGALSGREAAVAIQAGFSKFFPNANFSLLPLADGGEGIIEAFSKDTDSIRVKQTVTVLDALERPVETDFLTFKHPLKTAVIESSNANGLWRIHEDERDPAHSSTFGVGQLIRKATEMKIRRIIIGIGGSATNDAGAGMAAALGYRFLDSAGNEVAPLPVHFLNIASIDTSGAIPLPEITVACDVDNPLLGPNGASRTYGPQKGLLAADMETAEAGLKHFASVVRKHLASDFTKQAGAGAAGGLGYGLMTFCGAKLESGFDCVAGELGAEELISRADFVITAEGSLDAQTLNGKVPYGVAKLARKHKAPVYALAGRVLDEELLYEFFDGISTILNGPMDVAEAIANAPKILEQGAARLAHQIYNHEMRRRKNLKASKKKTDTLNYLENRAPYVF